MIENRQAWIFRAMHSISLIHFYLVLSIWMLAPCHFPSVGSWTALSDLRMCLSILSLFKASADTRLFSAFLWACSSWSKSSWYQRTLHYPISSHNPACKWDHPPPPPGQYTLGMNLIQAMYFKLGLLGPVQGETIASVLCGMLIL